MLKPGDTVADLLGTDQNGQEIRLSDFSGKKVILYFYPKDSTPGCTAEACNLRDNLDRLADENYSVVGVSVDSPESHQRFIAKNALPFPLIADTNHRLVEEFGVWGEKKLAGRTYMGTLRTTFIIDPATLTILRVIGPKEIKTKAHAEQILS